MDLSTQIVNIAKAGAFDVVSKQVVELKQVIRDLIEKGGLDDVPPFQDEELEKEFRQVLNKAKILSL